MCGEGWYGVCTTRSVWRELECVVHVVSECVARLCVKGVCTNTDINACTFNMIKL